VGAAAVDGVAAVVALPLDAVGALGVRLSSGAGACDGNDEQATIPRIPTASTLAAQRKAIDMWLILLEALGALVVLGLIVWWTMFSGRRNGERK